MAYLDDGGLAYFWGKIKAWANSVFALLGHTHPSSDVTLMTGYSKPASGSAIAASDTLNQAVGKLEAKADEALDGSGFVHKTGDETVAGEKTFTGPFSRSPYVSGIILRNPLATRGVVPSDVLYWALVGCDASGAEYDYSGNHGRSFVLSTGYGTASNNYRVRTSLVVYDNVASSTADSAIHLGIDSDGIAYAAAPSTSSLRNNSTDIVTRGWIGLDSRIVHTSGAETVGGAKTFTSNVFLENSNPSLFEKVTGYARGTSASESFYANRLSAVDNNGLTLISIYHRLNHDTNAHSVSFLCYKFNSISSSDYISLSLGYDADGYTYATCPSTSSNRTNGTDIVTRNWIPNDTRIVHTTGNETITGLKTFSTNSSLMIPLKSTAVQINTDVSSTTTCGFSFADKNNVNISIVEGFAYTSKNTGISILTRKWASTASTFRGVQLSWQNNDDIFFRPADSNLDNVYLGGSSYRWKAVFSANGTIQTSDERMKSEIGFIPDAVLDAWAGVDFCQFKFNAAIGREGREAARFHTGVVAQKVQKAFSDAGLDASRYGLFCYDRWDAEPEQLRDDGTVLQSALEAGDMYSMRYEEALCMEAACMRRENARLKKRVADLEERLAALELKVS